MKVDQQPAFLLHERKLSDSKRLYSAITPNYGLVSFVARAATKKQTPLMLFSSLTLSWFGNAELKTLTAFESSLTARHILVGRALYCGFYLNEITLRIAPRDEESLELFQTYQDVLQQLASNGDPEPALRQYELVLLTSAGYAVSFSEDISGQPINPKSMYRLVDREGFQQLETVNNHSPENSYSGAILLVIDSRNYTKPECRIASKQILRKLLRPLLGGKPLKSRELFKMSLLQELDIKS